MLDYAYGLGFFTFGTGLWLWLIGIPVGYLGWQMATNYITDKTEPLHAKGIAIEKFMDERINDIEDPWDTLWFASLGTMSVAILGFVWPVALPICVVLLSLRCLRWCFRLKTKVGSIGSTAHKHTGDQVNIEPVITGPVKF
jgi:hypothetical protein